MILKGRLSGRAKKLNKYLKKTSCSKMEDECPLCQDQFDIDEASFLPCPCGYKVCRFCWHRIRTNENGLCPHCRRQYAENPAVFKPLSTEEIAKLKNEKKMSEMRKKKDMAEFKKKLANTRVIQKNLVYVHGFPIGIDTQEEVYRRLCQIFKEYGALLKCVVNNKTTYAGSQVPKASIYITYQKVEDALRAFKFLPSRIVNYDIRTSLGTTKYCSNFLKNTHCPKQDCMYLHEIADDVFCYSKEQIHAGEHQNFGDLLYEQMLPSLEKSPQSNQSKDPHTSEVPLIQEIVVEPKIVESKDEVSNQELESSQSPQKNASPPKSKLQKFFCTRQPEIVNESELFQDLRDPLPNGNIYSGFVGARTNGEVPVQMNLSEEITLNNCVKTQQVNSTVISDNTRIPKEVSRDRLWQRKSSVEQSNSADDHQHTNNFPTDRNILNGIDSAAHILNSLSLNGASDSIFTPTIESPQRVRLVDELGFDPFLVAKSGLREAMIVETIPKKCENTARPLEQQQKLQHHQQFEQLLQLEQQQKLEQNLQLKHQQKLEQHLQLEQQQKLAQHLQLEHHQTLEQHLQLEHQQKVEQHLQLEHQQKVEQHFQLEHHLHHQHLQHMVHLQQHQQMSRAQSSQIPRAEYQNANQRLKNPPPGFPVNNIQPSEPQPSSAYKISSNVLIQRISPNSPALNLQNPYKTVRLVNSNNFPIQRFPPGGVTINSNGLMNGYSPIRNHAPHNGLQVQTSLQNPTMHEFIPRPMPPVPQVQMTGSTIQYEHAQYAHPEPSLPSPSYWGVSQSQQWVQAEAAFQAQNLQDFAVNSASPLLHRRMQPQVQPQPQVQQRPLDFNRPIPQATVQFNPSPFLDNNQFMFPNAQQNQQHKEVYQ